MPAGLGAPDITDEDFLLGLSREIKFSSPAEAGELAREWRDKEYDGFIRAVAAKANMGPLPRATLRTLVLAEDREGILGLVREQRKGSFLTSAVFLVPAGFFALGLVVYPAIMRR